MQFALEGRDGLEILSSMHSLKILELGVPIMAQWKEIWLASMRTQVRSLASLNGLRIQRCQGLWCRSQTRLGSGIAVAVAAPIRPLDWEPPYTMSVHLKKDRGKKKKKGKSWVNDSYHFWALMYVRHLKEVWFFMTSLWDKGENVGSRVEDLQTTTTGPNSTLWLFL